MWAAAHAAYYDRRGNRCGAERRESPRPQKSHGQEKSAAIFASFGGSAGSCGIVRSSRRVLSLRRILPPAKFPCLRAFSTLCLTLYHFLATKTAPPSRFAKRGPFAVHRAASMSSSFCARALCPSRSRRRMSVEETSSPCSYTGGTMTAAKSMVALISPMRRASPCP